LAAGPEETQTDDLLGRLQEALTARYRGERELDLLARA
jgi:hypothetical protein